MTFSIPDSLLQTAGFVGLCIGLGALVVGLIYLLRARQTAARNEARLKARTEEREREARELQDTLLQNTQGLILRFQAATEQIPEGNPARKTLEEVLARAEEVLADETERVVDLSVPGETANDLVQAFAIAGRELLAEQAVTFQALAEGLPRDLNSDTKDEIYAIGREALSNAIRHARARSIEVQVIYDEDQLVVRIRDDGHGVGSRVLEESARSGHSGVASMRAWAARLGARLEIWSRPGAGTEVELRVPSRIAYRKVTDNYRT